MFNKYSFENLVLKNRFVRSATNEHLGNRNGTLTKEEISVYEELAKNEVGLIITANYAVDEFGRIDPYQSLISDDKYINDFKSMVSIVHKNGSKIIAQINHGGYKASKELNYGRIPKGPSHNEKGEELIVDEIENIKNKFIQAAKRAKEAGFDGVQVHMAHGYLLSQFMDKSINKRNDEFGVDLEGRFHLPHLIIKGIKNECGNDYPVLVKIDCNNLNDFNININEMKELGVLLKNAGVDAIEISGLNFTIFKSKDKEGYYIDAALAIKETSSLPVILVGGIHSKSAIKDILDKGVDLVSMSRPFICQPDLIKEMKNGLENAKCIRCNQCFKIFATKHVRCVLHTTPNNQLEKNFK